MKVTDKNYFMEKFLVGKMDLMCDRCSGKKNFDNLIIIDGDEGTGKTTLAVSMAYYMAWKTGREFTVKNMFFDVEKLIEFARSTKDQVIIWDESALSGLATEWASKTQKQLIKLLMVARKKRHIWIFNIPKFFTLKEYIILDRAVALIHTYARDEKQLGHFFYYRKAHKEQLYYYYKRTRRRTYNKFKSFHGTFGNHLDKLIDEKEYDKMKDKAIMGIGADPKAEMRDEKKEKIMQIYDNLKKEGKNNLECMKILNIAKNTLYKYLKERRMTSQVVVS